MTDEVKKPDENIIIRTMKGDLDNLNNPHPKKEEKLAPIIPTRPISQEAQVPAVQTPASFPLPPKLKPKVESGPPILIIPQKTIPSKEIAEIPTKPLFKAMPIWIKIGSIGLGIFLLIIFGLYGYWKIFVQSQPIASPKVVTPTQPTLPTTPIATTTTPIKFFNKLPNKNVTIEISSKTPSALLSALKSESIMEETIGAIKEIKITFQGKPITTEEFFNLMFIFTPQNFLLNYESEFVLAFFSQKEGARPILILKSKKKSETEAQMKDWEAANLASGIFPLFLSDNKLPETTSSFKSYLFIGQLVRYLNIGMPFASLNYAIYNDFLIFSTSSAGMFVILQDLTGQTVSANYLENLKASINEFVR